MKQYFVCGRNSFIFVREPKSWIAAQSHCKNLAPGWSLATIHNWAQNSAVANLVGFTHSWIGFHDRATEGPW